MNKYMRGLLLGVAAVVVVAAAPVVLPALAGAIGLAPLLIGGAVAAGVIGARSDFTGRFVEARRARIAAQQSARIQRAQKLGVQRAKDKANVNEIKQRSKAHARETKALLHEAKKRNEVETRAKAQIAAQPAINAAQTKAYEIRAKAQADKKVAKANAYATRLAKTFNPVAAIFKKDKTARVLPMLPRVKGSTSRGPSA